jgi:hypothetical protein
VKEHLVFTPGGLIAHIEQIPGNRHDVQGLYSMLKSEFQGHLVGDNAYWPSHRRRRELAEKHITVTAATRSNWKIKLSANERALLKKRFPIERRIGLFNEQFHAERTLSRSRRHYEARRCSKALAHNVTRYMNYQSNLSFESVAHYRLSA